MSIEKCGQLREKTCPVCGKNFILPKAHTKNWAYTYIDKTPGKIGKIHYLCSWHCQKKMKYDYIMSKDKLTSRDVSWLEAHGYEVPREKMPKWLLEEPKGKKKG